MLIEKATTGSSAQGNVFWDHYLIACQKGLSFILSIWPGTGRQKTVVLDIGANLGIYGLYAAKLGFKVWAVEPQVANLMKVWSNNYLPSIDQLY